MSQTPEGGKKAMESRAQHEGKSVHEVAASMGSKGGHTSSGHKSMETRAKKEGKSVSEIASEMGSKNKGTQKDKTDKNE